MSHRAVLSGFCFLPSAFFCLVPSAFCLDCAAFRLDCAGPVTGPRRGTPQRRLVASRHCWQVPGADGLCPRGRRAVSTYSIAAATRCIRWTSTARRSRTLVEIGGEEGRLLDPSAFDVAADGSFAVADAPGGRERVQVFGPAGIRTGGFTRPGRLPGVSPSVRSS